ncbi:KRR1 small subunit processome component homolog [Triticum dicoccoides]|uniref:KRR1 small subunit processome component homolog n=1 Tax=Triticum dicoccoides TaxID=85692 RepID=UPI00188F57B0|nr:KRR1 small subunit processome component homolog [Triticum dicoccoides]
MASEGGTNAAAAATEEENQRRKGKPWDEDGPGSTDRLKAEKLEPSPNEGPLLETTSFSTTFAKDREESLLEAWPVVKGALKEQGVSCKLSLSEGSMTVSTTRKTRDPYIVVKARDLTRLLSRSVPVHQAIKILNDDMTCDIIKIGDLVRNRKRFSERRERLLGPNMSTLKAIENLTGCYILVQGNTVAAMGSLDGRGLKQVRKIAEDCMNNIKGPLDHIQELKKEREPAKTPALTNESWGRILPEYEKENIKLKKPYTPFPSPQQPSKTDIELENGKHSLSDKKKSTKKLQEKPDKQSKKVDGNKRTREAASIPPKGSTAGSSESAMATSGDNEVADMVAMPSKKKAKK